MSQTSWRHAPRVRPVFAAALVLGCVGLGVQPFGAERGLWLGPNEAQAESTATQMRRARFALLRGASGQAEPDLTAVWRSAPSSVRGLEAAFLLANLYVSTGRADEADAILEEAGRADTNDTAPVVRLARGWLAIYRADGPTARASFDASRRASSALVRRVAELGLAWTSLRDETPPENIATIEGWADRPEPLALRLGAAWTVARAYALRGDHRKALRELRRLRRHVRGTPYEDDLELLRGLTQLGAGRAADARRSFARLERRFGGNGPVRPGLLLEDLRSSNAELVDRVGRLYAERVDPSVGLLPFLAGLLDRNAGADAPAALALAEHALRAQKGAAR